MTIKVRALLKYAMGPVAGVALLVSANGAAATPVVDQAQLSYNTGIPLPEDVPVGQSFKAGITGLLTQIDLFSNSPSAGGTGTMTVYSGDGLGGTVLGAVALSIPSPGGAHPIPLDMSSAGIFLTAGNTYTFALTSYSGSQNILASTANPYADGIQYNNAGWYGSTPTWDLGFRTYVDADVVPVPEPGMIAMLGVGLAGMAFSRRRRVSPMRGR